MSTRSNVGLCIKTQEFNTLKDSILLAFGIQKFEDADWYLEHKSGVLIYIEDVKYDFDNPNHINLRAKLAELNTSTYLLVEVCLDYPDDDSNCIGAWHANPWNLKRRITYEVSFHPQPGS